MDSRYKDVDLLNVDALKKELQFFVDLCERLNWDVQPRVTNYMNRLQVLINSLS